MIQHRVLRAAVVAENHVVEVHGAVLHFGDGVFRADDVALFIQHFHDTLGGSAGDNDHHKNHAQHHQAGQDLHGIGEQAGQFTGGQPQRRVAAAGYDRLGAQPRKQQHAAVDAELHQRHIEGQQLFGLAEVLVDLFRNIVELLNFVIFLHEGLDHADAVQVLLHHIVQPVIALEDPLEDGVGVRGHQIQAHAQHRNENGKDAGKLRVDGDRRHQREDQHEGRTHRRADDHLVGVLHIAHVGGQARDQTAGGEPVDIGKGEFLNMAVHVPPQILGETGGSHRRIMPGQNAEQKRRKGGQQQHQPRLPDVGHAALTDALVDQAGHNQRNNAFHDHFQRYVHGRFEGCGLVFPHAFE